MPPPTSALAPPSAFYLRLLPATYAVEQLAPSAPLPAELVTALTQPVPAGEVVSLTRTDEEVSVVRRADEGTWRCIKIMGPMAFDVTGVVADFTAPLKQAGVGVFVASTWNTDYVLVPKEKVDVAVGALERDGWHFVQATE